MHLKVERQLIVYNPKVTIYSGVSNKRAGWNKRAGGTFFGNTINEQSGISKQGGFFLKNLLSKKRVEYFR